MNEPVRLMRDPAFREELGCDLADEALTLVPPDLDALRARVLAGGSAPAPRIPLAARWRVVVGMAMVVVAVLWWASPRARSGSAVQVEPPPESAGEVVPTVAGHPPDDPLPVGPPAVSAPRAHAPSPPPPAAPPEPSPSGVAAPSSATQADPPAPPAAAPAAPPPPTGDLAAQLAAFGDAEELLGSRSPDAALGAYRAYLTRWPDGVFRAEARLGELRAERALGDAAAVEALAADLARDPALSGRQAEILALRAQALVQLGRCGEAEALADGLSREARRFVRRACANGLRPEIAP